MFDAKAGLPKAVDFKTGVAINVPKNADYIDFKSVGNKEKKEEKPTKQPDDESKASDAEDDEEDAAFAQFEKTIGDKLEAPANAELEIDEDELEAKLNAAEVDEDADTTIPINELFDAELIVDGVDGLRIPGYMSIYEWRAEKAQIEKYFKYLSSLQSRSDEQQKQWQELDAWLKEFSERYDSLEKKVAWSERHKNILKKFLDRELSKLGDKRIPIGLYILGMEVVGLGRVIGKSTKRDDLSFELPENIPSPQKTK